MRPGSEGLGGTLAGPAPGSSGVAISPVAQGKASEGRPPDPPRPAARVVSATQAGRAVGWCWRLRGWLDGCACSWAWCSMAGQVWQCVTHVGGMQADGGAGCGLRELPELLLPPVPYPSLRKSRDRCRLQCWMRLRHGCSGRSPAGRACGQSRLQLPEAESSRGEPESTIGALGRCARPVVSCEPRALVCVPARASAPPRLRPRGRLISGAGRPTSLVGSRNVAPAPPLPPPRHPPRARPRPVQPRAGAGASPSPPFSPHLSTTTRNSRLAQPPQQATASARAAPTPSPGTAPRHPPSKQALASTQGLGPS